MERCYRAALLLLCGLLAVTLTRAGELELLCSAFTSKINTQVQAQQYLEAINSAAEYELYLRSCYPAPTYAEGVFRCAAYHFTFRNPMPALQFDQAATTDLPVSAKAIGLSWLANFSDTDGNDRLNVLVIDYNLLSKRTNGGYTPKFTDQSIKLQTKTFWSNLGAVSDEEYVMAAPHRVLLARVTTSALETPQWLATLAHDNMLVFFLYDAPNTAREQSRRQLLQLVSSLEWGYLSPDTARIAAIRAQHQRSIAQTLTGVNKLAMLGEYGSAAEDVARLRGMIAAKFPKPYVAKQCAYLPAYNITLRNPNPTGWNLTANREGFADNIILADKTAVTMRGIMVLTFGLHQSYGVEVVRELQHPQESDDLKKSMLRGGGRQGLLASSRGPLLAESFTTFKGLLAYQGVANSTEEGVRMKGVAVATPHALVMVLYLAPEKTFTKDLAHLEAIAAKYLTLQ